MSIFIIRIVPNINKDLKRKVENRQQEREVQKEQTKGADPRSTEEHRSASYGGLGVQSTERGFPQFEYGDCVPEPADSYRAGTH